MYNTIKDSRFAHPSTIGEMERRRAAVMQTLKQNEIDCIILYNYDNFLGGYTRYFTDYPVGNYPTTVFFHRDGDVVVVGHGAPDATSVPPFAKLPWMHTPATPLMPTLLYTDNFAPKMILDEVKRRGCKRIGFIAMSMVPAALYNYIREHMPGAELIDATDMVDRIKAIKSSEEIEGLLEAVRLHDCIASAVPAFFRPGKYEYEIVSDLKKVAADLHCEGLNIGLAADPVRPTMLPAPAQFRRVEPGDKLACLVEVSGPGGYYGEVARLWSLGDPGPELAEAMKVSADCQKMIAGMVKPGADPAELFRANNEFLTERGYAPEGRLFAHGQGFDMVERPAFSPAETMKLEENMFLAIHPSAVNEKVFALCCDNYLVTADGAKRITKTPMEIIIC